MIYFLTVNYYSTNLISKLINSLPITDNFNYKIIIVNNSPDDDSINKFHQESALIINAKTNLGFGSACNLGLQWIYGQDSQAIAWIINPDAYFLASHLIEIEQFFQLYPEISLLGTIIYTPGSEVWFAGGSFNSRTGGITTPNLLSNTNKNYIICDWISGCSLIINFSNFAECPLFDPTYFLYYEDFDLCRRYANQGHLIAITKNFSVIHQPSSITGKYIFRRTKHSTYSYLVALNRYTNEFIFSIRLIRLIFYALLLIVIKPKVAFGKFSGVFTYWRVGCRVSRV